MTPSAVRVLAGTLVFLAACGAASSHPATPPPARGVATLSHASALAAPYEVASVTYALDGVTVYEGGAANGEVPLGALAPGAHVLEASVRFRFVAAGPFAYLADRDLAFHASHAFEMPPERSLHVRATVYEHGEGPPEDRVGVMFADE